MKNLSTLFVGIFLLPIMVFSQTHLISGKVLRAETNEPLIGATVSVKGSTRGTITDLQGRYKLTVRSEVNLVAKYIGFRDMEIKITPLEREKITQDFLLVSNDNQLQDVVVSANKTEEFLQKVSVAATVVSSHDIETRSSYNTLEALKDAPLLITDSWVASQTSFSLRGLSNNFDNVGFESTVGLYLDDVYYSRSYIFNTTLFDIDRIEVLRGPQGTLFGKNTVGGVVNIISEKPEWANNGQVELVGGNYGYAQFRGKWNYQLIKNKLSMRLTGAYTRKDGYIKDPDEKVNAYNGTDFKGFRASLFYNPNEKTDISFKVHYGTDSKSEHTMVYLSLPDGENPLGIAPTDINTTRNNTAWPFYRNQFGTMLRANFKVGDNTFTSITSYNTSADSLGQDWDITSKDVTRWGRRQSLASLSQEFRIVSPRDKNFAYIAGIYFQNEKITGVDSSTINADFLPFAETQTGDTYPRIPNFVESYSAWSKINSTNVALFGSTSVKLTEKWKLNAGLRFTTESRQFSFYQNVHDFIYKGKPIGLMRDFYATQVASQGKPIVKNTNDNVLTYDLGLDYKVSPYVLSYAKFVRGFKGTGFNTSVTKDPTGSALVFKPEYVNSFEVGLKSKFSNRMRLNAAIFYTDYENKQEFLDEGTTVTIVNVDRAGGWGAEAEFSAMLKSFKIDISAGLLDLKYRKFIFGTDENGNPIDYSGNRLLKAPAYTISLSPSYTWRLKEKYNIMLGMNINSTGKSYNDISNSEIIARRALTLVNTRISFMPKDGKWSIALWGKNITNESYFQHGWEYIYGNQASLGRPRTYGIELYLNFF